MHDNLLAGVDVITSRGVRTDYGQNDNVSCFPRLSLKERLIAFAILQGLGILLQLGSLMRLLKAIATNEEERFALVYSAGNVMSILGLTFLVGVQKQIEDLAFSERRLICFTYFGSICFTILIALCYSNPFSKLLVCIGVIIQTIAFWWYAISYIPCGQRIAGGCWSCFKSLLTGR